MSKKLTKLTYNQLERVRQHWLAKAKHWEAKSQIEEVEFHQGYAEPGYDTPESGWIATGNWNTVTKYRDGKFVTVDAAPATLGAKLEALGVTLEWSDEWATCDECGKLVRTQADSYSWQRSFVECDDGCVCMECIDPAKHLESLEGQDDKCNTLDTIDPADHGYVKVEGGFENGWHHGQDADPKKIGQALRDAGVTRYLFQLDGAGQFDLRFSVWVHADDFGNLDKEKYGDAAKDGPSVSDGLARQLRNLPAPAKTREGVPYSSVTPEGVTTRAISPEDFVKYGALTPEEYEARKNRYPRKGAQES